MKVDKVSLNPITPDSPAKDGCQKDLTIHFPTREEVVAYNRDIIPQMLADGSAMKFGLTEQHLQVFGVTDEEIDSAMRGLMVDSLLRGNLCFKPWYFANINQDSKLIACNHVKECPEFPIGDLKEHSILELWNSEKYKAFRQKCKTPLDSFKSCSYCCFPYAIHNQKLNEKLRKNGKE
jgi:radical SAM protein with 4Fe4S-binding SPASM domain